ncbi:MAG: tryptophanyl-tRNA synthetase [Thermotogota bacterium]|nr:tryptophanyl-tRNA synthetase [Thermotogota bacterium]
MRVLSGMRATGKLHLGHLVGALRTWVELQKEHDTFYFVADWHALTTHYDDTSKLKQNTLEVARGFLACGIDPDRSVVFVQSGVKEHAELFLIFSMLAPVGRLERIPTYKEIKTELNYKDLSSVGFLSYPVLQAADILIYRAAGVPVGEDQVYHIEFTREIARRFNYYFGEVFPEPEPLLSPVPKLLGTDGRKMSKSYGNVIELDTPKDEVESKILRMVTDPARKRRTDPGDPEKCPVWGYHKAFTSSEEEREWVVEGCTKAKIGCVDCKKLLLKNMSPVLDEIRDRYASLSDEYVMDVVIEGCRKAREEAEKTMELVRKAVNLLF